MLRVRLLQGNRGLRPHTIHDVIKVDFHGAITGCISVRDIGGNDLLPLCTLIQGVNRLCQ